MAKHNNDYPIYAKIGVMPHALRNDWMHAVDQLRDAQVRFDLARKHPDYYGTKGVRQAKIKVLDALDYLWGVQCRVFDGGRVIIEG